jgi:hypothetical protein
MKRRRTSRPRARPLDPAAIDARYGLEPVFDPATAAVTPEGDQASSGAIDASAPFALIQCPYCGETYETRLDLSAGSASYIEDCQICCQAIEFSLSVTASGALQSLDLRRGN